MLPALRCDEWCRSEVSRGLLMSPPFHHGSGVCGWLRHARCSSKHGARVVRNRSDGSCETRVSLMGERQLLDALQNVLGDMVPGSETGCYGALATRCRG